MVEHVLSASLSTVDVVWTAEPPPNPGRRGAGARPTNESVPTDGLEMLAPSSRVMSPPPEMRGPWRDRQALSAGRNYGSPSWAARHWLLLPLFAALATAFALLPLALFAGLTGLLTLAGLRLLSQPNGDPAWLRIAWWCVLLTYVFASIWALR